MSVYNKLKNALMEPIKPQGRAHRGGVKKDPKAEKRRLAMLRDAGEITAEEYQRRVAALG